MPHKQDTSILFITYYFPPIHSIGVIRNYNLALQLKHYFNKVLVVTTSNQSFLSSQYDKLISFDTYLANTFDYRTILNRFSKKNKTHYSVDGRGFIARFLTRLNLSFPLNLIWGEGGIIYIWDAYRKGKKWVRDENISHIYSSFMPYSDHIVAYFLKRKFPHLYWIADFRDLHIDPVRKEVFFKRFQRWCNKKVLSKADLVTTVSRGLASHLNPFNKVYVLRNGIPSNMTMNLDSPVNEKFTISYTGSIYKGLRSPVLLLRVIQTLIDENKIDRQSIRIVYAGKDSASWNDWVNRIGLKELLIDKGLVSYQEALAIQKNSDCNLLMSWASDELQGVLTGKLYEYLVANRPIINITFGSSDRELEEVFSELNAGKIFYHDSLDDLKKYIVKLYTEWDETGKVEGTIPRGSLDGYYWDKLALNLIGRITS